MAPRKKIKSRIAKKTNKAFWSFKKPTIWHGTAETLLAKAPKRALFDLVVTSPPYNIGKRYERAEAMQRYLTRHRKLIEEIVKRLKPNGSLCWQVGNYVQQGEIVPLDMEFHKIFRKLGLKLRNRIIWRFGHGLHNSQRFSGRYEVILWYTKGDDYHFDLDAVRIPSKYPAKTHYKGEKHGQYSSNPLGKNPEDVWDIPNVKGNHVEKTSHPCQFPVGLIERLILALTKKNSVVFDPYAGVSSSGVAAVLHGRKYLGCERLMPYCKIGLKRLNSAAKGTLRYRPHDQPIYDHTKSPLSIKPGPHPKR